MGIEYNLWFSAPDAETVAKVLRSLPGARETSPSAYLFELDVAPTGPQATVQVKSGGAYFCDHCTGRGRALLGDVVTRLVSAFGPVTVNEE